MAKVVPLFSGSKGNSYYIGSSGKGILIDAGRSCKQIENALSINGLDMRNVEAIFITHEHSDHCSALRVLASRYQTPVFASAGTLNAMASSNKICDKFKCDVINDVICLNNMLVKRIDTSHDALESCCYQVTTADDKKAIIATDLGIVTNEIRQGIIESDFAVIESNHDVNLLKNGEYPYYLKQRILSNKGHLSNDSCAKELPYFVENNTLRLMLGHLSRENNTPHIAFQTALRELEKMGMKIGTDFTLEVVPEETNGKAVIF